MIRLHAGYFLITCLAFVASFLVLAPLYIHAQGMAVHCGDVSTDYGTECSLQELYDAPAFDGAYLWSETHDYRTAKFEMAISGRSPIGDPARIKVTLDDSDPVRPVVRFEPDPGTIRIDADDFGFGELTADGVLEGRFFFVRGRGFAVTAAAIKIDADFSTSHTITTDVGGGCFSPVSPNLDFEGGSASFSVTVTDLNATRYATTFVFDPPEGFPNSLPMPTDILEPDVPSFINPYYNFTFGLGLCDDPETGFQGSAQINSSEITFGLGVTGFPSPPPPTTSRAMPWLLLLE